MCFGSLCWANSVTKYAECYFGLRWAISGIVEWLYVQYRAKLILLSSSQSFVTIVCVSAVSFHLFFPHSSCDQSFLASSSQHIVFLCLICVAAFLSVEEWWRSQHVFRCCCATQLTHRGLCHLNRRSELFSGRFRLGSCKLLLLLSGRI